MNIEGEGYKSGPQCKICSKEFKAKNSLTNHYREIHKEDIKIEKDSSTKQIQCETCDKSFSNIGNLTQHEKKHSGMKVFECQH